MSSIGVFDVDGTLTDGSGAIAGEIVDLLRSLAERGVLVVLATARGPSGLAAIADRIGGVLSAVAYQGALVGRFVESGWTTEAETTIEFSLALDISELAEDLGLVTSWHAGSSWYVGAMTDEIAREAEIVDSSPEIVRLGVLTAPPHKLMFISRLVDTAKLEQLRALLPGAVDHAYSHPNYLEVSPAGVNKRTGLELLLRTVNGSAQDVIAFGDGENDIAMFEVAGRSFAMPHAPASVRSAATTVATDGLIAAVRAVTWRPFGPGSR